jgi:hypothetical protein
MVARFGMAFRGLGANPWDTPPISGNPQHQLPGVPVMGDPWSTPPAAGVPVPEMAPGALGGRITAQPPKPGFGDVGGTGDKLRRLAGHLMQIGGIDNSGQQLIQGLDEREQQHRQQQQQAAQWARQDTQRTQDRGWQVEDRDAKLKQPQYFMSGKDRVAYDPTTNQANVIYDGPEDYQNYADTLGLSPDDKEYGGAVQDFVLRGNGPTALEGRQSLEGMRQQNRMALRSTPTYANLHPAPRTSRASGSGRGGMAFSGPPRTMAAVIAPLMAKMASGQPLTPAEQSAMDTYRSGRGPRGGSRAGSPPAPATAPTQTRRNPATGEVVHLVNGKWVSSK